MVRSLISFVTEFIPEIRSHFANMTNILKFKNSIQIK